MDSKSAKKCWDCGSEIEAKRLLAVPTTNFCIACIDKHLVKTRGYNAYSHKTAPTIILSSEIGEEAFEQLRRHDRKGVHAQLPFSSRENPRTLASRPPEGRTAEFDAIRHETGDGALSPWTSDKLPSLCHPERPSIGPSRKCVECALDWYRRRLK